MMNEINRRRLLGGMGLLGISACGMGSALAVQGQPNRTETEFLGRNAIYNIPENCRGLVYTFHGSQGSERFAVNSQTAAVLDTLLKGGYGYFSTASDLRKPPKRWDTSKASSRRNKDIAHMVAVDQELRSKGFIEGNTPIYAMGMSNGAAFSHLFSSAAKEEGLPVAAVAAYMGGFPPGMLDFPTDTHILPPTFTVFGENDGFIQLDRTQSILQTQIERGAQIEQHIVRETLITPETFLVGKLAFEDRVRVVKILKDEGFIDAEGRRLLFGENPKITRAMEQELADKLPQEIRKRLIFGEILIAWAGHKMRSDYAEEQLAFFERFVDR